MPKHSAIIEIEQWCADHKGAFDTCEIFNITCKAFGVYSIADSSRKRELLEPRRCYVWFCYKLLKSPHPQCIARRIGKTRQASRNQFVSTLALIEAGDDMVTTNIQKVFTELKLQYERVQG